jgi:tetratricopeptide (TPR) repeat protein
MIIQLSTAMADRIHFVRCAPLSPCVPCSGLGRFQQAFFDLNAAIRLEPRNHSLYAARALVLRKLKRHTDALGDLNTALQLHQRSIAEMLAAAPGGSDAAAALAADPAAAAALLASSGAGAGGRPKPDLDEEAAAAAAMAAQAQAMSAVVTAGYRFFRGLVLSELDDCNAAVEDFGAAMTQEKYAARARLFRAECLQRLGRVADSIADLRALVRLNPESPDSHALLALALAEVGRYQDALKHLDAAVEKATALAQWHASGGSGLYPAMAPQTAVAFVAGATYHVLDLRAGMKFQLGMFASAASDAEAAVENHGRALRQAVSTASSYREAASGSAILAESAALGAPTLPQLLLDASPYLHKGSVALALGKPASALPDLLHAARILECLARKEMKSEAARNAEALAAGSAGGDRDPRSSNGATSGRGGPGSPRRRRSSAAGTSARASGNKEGGHASAVATFIDLASVFLAPELASLLGEPSPPAPAVVPAGGPGLTASGNLGVVVPSSLLSGSGAAAYQSVFTQFLAPPAIAMNSGTTPASASGRRGSITGGFSTRRGSIGGGQTSGRSRPGTANANGDGGYALIQVPGTDEPFDPLAVLEYLLGSTESYATEFATPMAACAHAIAQAHAPLGMGLGGSPALDGSLLSPGGSLSPAGFPGPLGPLMGSTAIPSFLQTAAVEDELELDRDPILAIEDELRTVFATVGADRIGRARRNAARMSGAGGGAAGGAGDDDDDYDQIGSGNAHDLDATAKGGRGGKKGPAPAPASRAPGGISGAPNPSATIGGSSASGSGADDVRAPRTLSVGPLVPGKDKDLKVLLWPGRETVFTMPRTQKSAILAAKVQIMLGLAYRGLGHGERALYHLVNATTAWPAWPASRYHCALQHHTLRQPAEAVAHLTALLNMTAKFNGEIQVFPAGAQLSVFTDVIVGCSPLLLGTRASPRRPSIVAGTVGDFSAAIAASSRPQSAASSARRGSNADAARIVGSVKNMTLKSATLNLTVRRPSRAEDPSVDMAASGLIDAASLSIEQRLEVQQLNNARAATVIWSPGLNRTGVIRIGICHLEPIPPVYVPPVEEEEEEEGGKKAEGKDGAKDAGKKDATKRPSSPTARSVLTGGGLMGKDGTRALYFLAAAEDMQSAAGLSGGGGGAEDATDPPLYDPKPSDITLQATARARAKVLVARGLAKHALGKYTSAVEDFTESIKENAAVPETYLHRAVSLLALSRARAAVDDCQTALKKGCGAALVHDKMGQGYAYVGAYDKAIAEYTSALQTRPGHPSILSRRAVSHRALGNHTRALEDLTKALEAPAIDKAALLCQRAGVHYELNDFKAAIADFKLALEQRTSTPLKEAEMCVKQ